MQMEKITKMRKFQPRISTLVAVLWLALLILPVGLFLTAPQSAHAQSKSYHMGQYNSDITVNPDGSLDVTETLVYVYDTGSFHRGTRTIDLSKVNSITGVKVTELKDDANSQPLAYRETSYDPDGSISGVPGTFGTETNGSKLNIRWVYNYTSSGTRVFTVSYHAAGAVRVYSDRDVVDWYAVPQNWGSPINASRVQLTTPANANNLLATTSKPQAETSKQGNSVVWTTSSNLDSGFEVGAQLPAGVLQATAPSWQAGVDTRDNVQPVLDIGLFVLGVIIAILGVLLAIIHWYSKGRDKPVKLTSDYLTEPPSDLPPGLVGTLVDESADVRDVIATVVDQGRKGNLTMRETGQGGILSGKDFEYAQTGNKVSYRFEEMTLQALFKHGNPVQLSGLKNTFYSDLPPIYDEMYRSLVALKYFPENPKSVRARNVAGGVGLLILAGLVFFASFTIGDLISPWLIVPAIGLAIAGIAWLAIAGAMPRKTDFGSEQAEKWRAFSRYLQEMQRYTNVQAAADKFQQYLPYAVAMGIERQLINQFNSVPSAMPGWYAPYGYYPYGYFPLGVPLGQQTASVGGASGGGGMPQFDPGGAIQGMSNSLGSAMQGMSDSFTSMVNSASSIMTSAPSSSGSGGGGWGGGGGSFGGGGGGGGGGGAD